jgi:hypothetical protein
MNLEKWVRTEAGKKAVLPFDNYSMPVMVRTSYEHNPISKT